MTTPTYPLSQQVIIINELGLHARSAAKIANIAQTAYSTVWVEKDGDRADAASIIDLLTLACPKGTGITVAITDPADTPVLDQIVNLIKDGFGE